jgi:solute carrier family 35 (adenosine 3'-phospho 5'-phosphosulfate transporter), member B3
MRWLRIIYVLLVVAAAAAAPSSARMLNSSVAKRHVRALMANTSTARSRHAVVRPMMNVSTGMKRHKDKIPIESSLHRMARDSAMQPPPRKDGVSIQSPPPNGGSRTGDALLAMALVCLVCCATAGLRRLAAAPPWTHMVVCSSGVFVSFILHDFLQETIVKSTHGSIPLGMTAFEFLACAMCPAAELLASGKEFFATGGTAPRWAFPGLSAFLLASMVLGNIALKYVSYPVKVVLKSSKLLPAMVMGRVMLGKRYLAFQYLSALLLCIGVIGCSYADRWVSNDGKAFSGLGLSLLLCAVCCDAISPVVQEQLLGKHQVHAAELMLRTNLIALGGVAVAWAASAEYKRYHTLWETADGAASLLVTLCGYGMTSYVGVTFMLALIDKHGSAVGVAVGTLRKVVTIVISFLWWHKPFSLVFSLSGLAVFASIALNSQAKRLEAALCGIRR